MNDAHGLKVASDGADYISDIYPADSKVLTGTVNSTPATTVLKGVNTGFLSDLKVGDLIEVGDSLGTTKRMEVKVITSNVALKTVEKFPVVVSNSTITRVRTMIEEPVSYTHLRAHET